MQSLRRPSASGWPDVRVACVWLPELPMRVEVLRNPKLADRPLVVGGGPGQRHVVTLVSAAAAQAGVRPGLPLREVLPLCPGAVVIPPDPIRTAGVLDAVAGALERVGPTVEVADEALYLDLRGLQKLYRGELANLERALRRAVPSLLLPRLGAGGGKFAALAAARSASVNGDTGPTASPCPSPRGRGDEVRMVVVSGEQTRAFLAPQSVDLLPLGPEQLEWLRQLGMRTIGQVAALPVGAAQAQLGPDGVRAWHLARGHDDEPVVPRRPVLVARAAMRFDDPLASVDAVFFALDQLLGRAFADPLMRARSARQLRLGALLSDGTAWERVITFKEPIAGARNAFTAVKHRLSAAAMLPPAMIEELVVELRELDAVPGYQGKLFVSQASAQDFLTETVERLRARYGRVPLYRARPIEPWSRVPENRWVLVPLRQEGSIKMIALDVLM